MSKKSIRRIAGYVVSVGTTAIAATVLVASFAQSSGASAQLAANKGLKGVSFSFPEPGNVKNVANNEFAGYEVTPLNGFASASTTFVVPSLQNYCSNSKFNDSVLQFGIGDINTSTSRTLDSDVEEYCQSGVPVYYYVAATQAGTIVKPATPGDTVVTSMFQTGSWSEAEVHDLTNGQYWVSDTSASANATAVAIAVQDCCPAVPFLATTMSMDQINGDYLGFDSPTANNLVDPANNHTLVVAGTLGSHGSSFRLTFKQSS